ncbi:hypothetical protein D3C87_2200250 [compost metagenome]
MNMVWCTLVRVHSMISSISGQYRTSSKGRLAMGAPVTMKPSNLRSFTSSQVW